MMVKSPLYDQDDDDDDVSQFPLVPFWDSSPPQAGKGWRFIPSKRYFIQGAATPVASWFQLYWLVYKLY
jgi:hypothetical protein